MKRWKIIGWDEAEITFEAMMPGNMTSSEITAVLQRMACRHLTNQEVIAGSLRKNYRGYVPLLERIGSGTPIHVGTNPYYTAHLIDT